MVHIPLLLTCFCYLCFLPFFRMFSQLVKTLKRNRGWESEAHTVILETGKGHPHTDLTNLQNERRDARVADGKGKWSSDLQEELTYIVEDFKALGYTRETIENILEQQYKMLDKLNIPYRRINLDEYF